MGNFGHDPTVIYAGNAAFEFDMVWKIRVFTPRRQEPARLSEPL